MSYRIDEGVADTQRWLRAETTIAKRYPATYRDRLPNGDSVWICDDVAADATDVRAIVGGKDRRDVYLCAYVDVEGMPVYARPMCMPHGIFASLKVQRSDLYDALVAIVAGREAPRAPEAP